MTSALMIMLATTLVSLAVAGEAPIASPAPLPAGVSAEAANLGPLDGPFRLDFAYPTVRGCDPALMDLQLVHGGMVIIGNDYTHDAMAAAVAAHKDQLAEIRGRKINAWVKFKEEAGIVNEAFLAAYTQFAALDDPTNFTITSDGDPAYAGEGRHPEKVTRYAMPRGNYRDMHLAKGRVNTFGTLLANYSYLTLPSAMKPGRTYRFAQRDGRSVGFVYHEDLTVSRALKVNQTGYSPKAGRKYAYLGLWQAGIGPIDFSAWNGKPFEVVDANTRKVVHRGRIALLAHDPMVAIQKAERPGAGEDLYELDLSELKEEGEFYLRVPGIGRSWPFLHHQDAIGRGFYIHLRGLFHQRAGHELEARYTGWPRPLAHAVAYVCDYAPETAYSNLPVNDFAAIRAYVKDHPNEVEWGEPGRGGVGGWYDAADFDRRWYHYDTVFDLLLAYELQPSAFTDGQENTYESGNRIPDILDEVAWGLLVWRNSQDEKGGIAGHVESPNHPDATGAMPDGRPHHDPAKMYVSRRTRGCSLSYAGAAAHLARLIKPFAPDEAAKWLDSAKRAWAFGIDPANRYAVDDYAGSGKPCHESDELIVIAGCEAGLELYLTTGDRACLERALAWYPDMRPLLKWPLKYVHQDYWWGFSDDPAIPAAIRAEVRASYVAAGDVVEGRTHEKFYRSPIDQRSPWPTTWGKATAVQDARALAMAYGMSRDRKYLDGIALACDWEQGANPLGLSWTSGIGCHYPWCFFNGESEEDGIVDPVPGLTVYGPTGGIPIDARRCGFNLMEYDSGKKAWKTLKRLQPDYVKVNGDDLCPDIPFWRGWVMDYHAAPEMQEYTVNETISPSVLAYAALLGDGWRPSERLKAMKPRDPKWLIGLWPTP
jgi:endoglucanase